MIKTMAIKITEDNYPIAVACLPDGFALIRKSLVLGTYLVINDLMFPDDTSLEGSKFAEIRDEEEEFDPRPRASYNRIRRGPRYGLMLQNFWTRPKSFKKDFKIIGEVTDKTSFFEITRR